MGGGGAVARSGGSGGIGGLLGGGGALGPGSGLKGGYVWEGGGVGREKDGMEFAYWYVGFGGDAVAACRDDSGLGGGYRPTCSVCVAASWTVVGVGEVKRAGVVGGGPEGIVMASRGSDLEYVRVCGKFGS